ncbi:MAG: hypothetical protein EG823_03975 [Actinobacteria bacterium]|nr:hypothetical protein [Actinomycetota bacterium]
MEHYFAIALGAVMILGAEWGVRTRNTMQRLDMEEKAIMTTVRIIRLIGVVLLVVGLGITGRLLSAS